MVLSRKSGRAVRRLRPHLSILISATLIASAVVVIMASVPGSSTARSLHMPIVIEGDSDFVPSSGVRGGAGTEGNPYVISGWNIQLSSGVGITIANTTAHFLILDVQVNGTASQWADTSAVYIRNSANWAIQDSVFNDTTVGLSLYQTTNASVSHCAFYSISTYCLWNADSLSVNVVGCDFLAPNPIYGRLWTNSVVLGNTMRRADVAIYLDQGFNVTVEGNTIDLCARGVSLSACFSISIFGNEFTNCTDSVFISYTDFVDLKGNAILGSRGTAVSIVYLSYLVLPSFNLISGSSFGAVYVNDSHDIRMNDNMIEDNNGISGLYAGGVTLNNSYSIWVDRNNFDNNTPVQALDPGANFWNNEYPLGGNWWSDYVGVDLFSGPAQNESGSDGFGDTPYVIDADSQDNYPFMSMINLDRPPVANVTADPLAGDVTTTFNFSGSLSSDPDIGTGDSLRYRWDFNGDGNWDTAWSSDPNTTHSYFSGQNYTVVLEVTDNDGVVDIAMVEVTVSGSIIPEFSLVIMPALGLLAIVAALVFVRRE